MQTIFVKYLGPTDHLGSRYKATHTGGFTSVTVSADYSIKTDDNFAVAAKQLAEKLNWGGSYIGGHTADGMVFVNAEPAYTFTTDSKGSA